jgi:hypothetical protein
LTSVRLQIILFGLRTANKLSGTVAGDNCARLDFYLNPSFITKKIKIKISCSRIDVICTPLYSFSASEGKYLEPATSLHPIKAEGYEIRPNFISLIRELNFTGGLDENPYKSLQDFEEICATLMISGMNHEALKWKAFPFSLTGWVKQWYKFHVNSCQASWIILKDQFCFAFFPLSKIIDLRNEVLNFAQKEGETLGAAWSKYNQLALSGPELSILDAMFMQHFLHGLGTESTKYLDMTSRGVFVHCTVVEGKSILDRILLVPPAEDLQIEVSLISEDELIISYPDALDISALPVREELLQLTAPGIGSENEI